FFSYATPSTASSALALHDALPIYQLSRDLVVERDEVRDLGARKRLAAHVDEDRARERRVRPPLHRLRRRRDAPVAAVDRDHPDPDRKSTRLNSSHVKISYAVFCLK